MLVILVLERLRQENHELGVHNEPKNKTRKTLPHLKKKKAKDRYVASGCGSVPSTCLARKKTRTLLLTIYKIGME